MLIVAGAAAMLAPLHAESESRPDFRANLKPTETALQPFTKVHGHASFYLNEERTRLRYEIKINNLGIEGYAVPGEGHKDMVVAAQIRHAAPGLVGPVVFTFFGEMGQDDGNFHVDSIVPTFAGVWDDDDANETSGTRRLSSMLGALCAGELYVDVQTADRPGGALRGQIHARPGVCR
jgi:hypothetical protein